MVSSINPLNVPEQRRKKSVEKIKAKYCKIGQLEELQEEFEHFSGADMLNFSASRDNALQGENMAEYQKDVDSFYRCI
jgi:hypothetical protein